MQIEKAAFRPISQDAGGQEGEMRVMLGKEGAEVVVCAGAIDTPKVRHFPIKPPFDTEISVSNRPLPSRSPIHRAPSCRPGPSHSSLIFRQLLCKRLTELYHRFSFVLTHELAIQECDTFPLPAICTGGGRNPRPVVQNCQTFTYHSRREKVVF